MGHAQVWRKECHTLGMLDEATTLVEERWCTPYRIGDQDTSPLSTRRCTGVVNHGPDGMGSLSRGRRMR
jgi:hypothetical protein